MFAILLNECLEKEGVKTFFDAKSKKTQEYKESILNGVRSCGLFICILCPKFFEQQWCLRELMLAIEWKTPVLPVFYKEIEGNYHHDLLKQAKGRQGFRDPPITKADVIQLKNSIIAEVKVVLGSVIPVGLPVTIRLGQDDVYEPSQQGWIVSKGMECSLSRDAHFTAINPPGQCEQRHLSFIIRQSEDVMPGEDCYGYAFDVAGEEETSLAVAVYPSQGSGQMRAIRRDTMSHYVFLRARKSDEFQWRIVPQGNHRFHILYHRTKSDPEPDKTYASHFENDVEILGIKETVHLNEVNMGLAAHRFWRKDLEAEGGTRLMVTLDSKHTDYWEIEKNEGNDDEDGSLVPTILFMARSAARSSPHNLEQLISELEALRGRRSL